LRMLRWQPHHRNRMLRADNPLILNYSYQRNQKSQCTKQNNVWKICRLQRNPGRTENSDVIELAEARIIETNDWIFSGFVVCLKYITINQFSRKSLFFLSIFVSRKKSYFAPFYFEGVAKSVTILNVWNFRFSRQCV
jgi:hypothetical protein